MIENKIEDLFNTINNSSEYQDYIEIKNKLEANEEINEIISDIKKLQKEATYLEYHEDKRYLEVDEQTKKKVDLLNSKPLYQEYLAKMKKLNDVLATSSKMLENYLNDKI